MITYIYDEKVKILRFSEDTKDLDLPIIAFDCFMKYYGL